MRTLDAVLPRKNADELSAKLFANAYAKMLGHMPEQQISFIADFAVKHCKWFPTIAECLEIAALWKRDDAALRAHNWAQAAVWREKQARMEDTMKELSEGTMGQAEINALPERWQSIAETRGLLRRLADGSFERRENVIGKEKQGE